MIGVSIDGPEDIHDAFRRDRGGKATWRRVMDAIELMAAQKVEYNTLSTVNRESRGRGAEVYGFLKSIGSHYMQFLPVVEYVTQRDEQSRPIIVPPNTPHSSLASWSIAAKDYGEFMNDIFDCWVVADVGRYYVQLFDVALGQWVGAPAGLCAFGETCGDALVVEHNLAPKVIGVAPNLGK